MDPVVPLDDDEQMDEQTPIPPVKGIVRIDISTPKHTHGWQARVYTEKTMRTQFFSDRKYGGRVGSHQEAMQALRRIQGGAPIPRRPKRPSAP